MPCTTLTVGSALPDCNTIPLDSWKPDTLNPKTGDPVNFVLRSKTPNQEFEVVDMGSMQEILHGYTDTNGCYKGSFGPLADGTHQIAICYPLGPLCAKFGYQNITWGSKGTDYVGIAIIAGTLLGLGYFLTKKKGGD